MTDPQPKRPNALQKSDPEKYARLLAESKAPYRGLRQFIYVAFGLSGAIGGFVFLFRVLAGRDLDTALPNLALQIGVVALMVFLFRWDQGR
jgi:Low psii accumulation1 / Rep27